MWRKPTDSVVVGGGCNIRIVNCKTIAVALLAGLLAVCRAGNAAEQVLTEKFHHLRSGTVREWADFPEHAEATELRVTFPTEYVGMHECLSRVENSC